MNKFKELLKKYQTNLPFKGPVPVRRTLPTQTCEFLRARLWPNSFQFVYMRWASLVRSLGCASERLTSLQLVVSVVLRRKIFNRFKNYWRSLAKNYVSFEFAMMRSNALTMRKRSPDCAKVRKIFKSDHLICILNERRRTHNESLRPQTNCYEWERFC